MTATLKPGEKPPRPGEYEERGPRGGQIPDPRQATITKDDGHLPPTQESGNTWVKVPKPDKHDD
jgi:hypothetical protein